MNRFAGWTLCVVTTTGLLVLGQGCDPDSPEGSGLDALDGGAADGSDADADAEGGRDALVGDDASKDAGPTDVGLCNCSFGFHQQCAADELCMAHYVRSDAGQPACTPVSPTGSGGMLKNAQCSKETWDGCLNWSSDSIAGAWSGVTAEAAHVATSSVPGHISSRGVAYAQEETLKNGVCGELIKWTILGLYQFCQGEATVIPPPAAWPPDWYDLGAWRFTHALAEDPCVLETIGRCIHDFSGTLEAVVGGVASGIPDPLSTERPTEACTDAMPYASPCDAFEGTAAQACAAERLRTILRVMLHP